MVKPYYEDASVTLYHGDARDILPEIRDVDLLLTDPPYGVSFESGYRTREQFGPIANDRPGDADVVLSVLALAVAALRECRHAYLFGPFSDDVLEGLRLTKGAEIVWDKGQVGLGNLSIPWGPQHERITFAVHVASAANRARGSGRLSARLRRGSVLRERRPNSTGVRLHPTEKPVGILREMIESSSCIGETVLDPFAGSGSALVAAVAEDRRAIGIEIEERYCEVAANRLRKALAA